MPTKSEGEQILSALAQVSTELRHLTEAVSGLIRIVSDPITGLVLRVDRLEQTEQRRSTWIKAAVGASVAAVAGFLGMLIKMVMKP